MIRIENKKTYHGDGVYIGRPSLLGNPFKVGEDGEREEVIAKYRRWLWEQIKLKNEVYLELKRIAALAKQGDITLICWCAPKPCHADILRSAVMWMIQRNEPSRDIVENSGSRTSQ